MSTISRRSSAACLGLGTAQFGLRYGIANRLGQVSFEDAKTIVNLASANGIDTLDTASAYGDSEACLGTIGVGSMKVVTKLAEVPRGGNAGNWVRDQVAASLARLGVGSIYALLLHRPRQLTEPGGKELFKAMMEMKDSGIVEKIGISIYGSDELLPTIDRFQLDVVQAPLNLVDRRIHSTGWLTRLKDRGIEIHTRSAFLQGLLLMPQEKIPTKFEPWSEVWAGWHKWLVDNRASAIATCLAYPLCLPEVDRVIVGVDSAEQMREIVSAAGQVSVAVPDLKCDDENLVDPTNWDRL